MYFVSPVPSILGMPPVAKSESHIPHLQVAFGHADKNTVPNQGFQVLRPSSGRHGAENFFAD